ncbi:hypothetical protein TRFO_37458 [Tritrichomonas foetus]|uniref:Guanylate cyclase domain-containing protein n=1 Tax=Tritrichomonas foetus TaxID=1144522 RepID=A0A1J4JG39_9EUKA|nr:hypothetical protein TRFO_37458 [Tritrichomonas foetus]|eukprot:OHS96413.1 hypothetical protein TRFO_37458 [Tritrichomonas foetus]
MITSNKKKLLKLTPFQTFRVYARDFFVLCRQSCLLPELLYKLSFIWQVILTVCPVFLAGIDNLWSFNPYLYNTIKFLCIFWRFGASYTGKAALSASFVIVISVQILCCIPSCLCMIIFRMKGRFPSILSGFVCFNHEILIPIVSRWQASQFATVLGLIISRNEYRVVFSYLQVFIFLMFMIFTYIFESCFVFTDSIYQKGRSNYWDLYSRSVCTFLIDVFLISTRLIELLSGFSQKFFAILSILILLAHTLFIYLHYPFVSMNKNIFLSPLINGFVIMMILQSISLFVKSLDITTTLFAGFIVILLGFFITQILQEKIIQKIISVLNKLESEEIEFHQAFKTSIHFLIMTRIGFQKGHSYIFTWKPFVEATKIWKDNEQIWMQYLKFIIIYFSENSKIFGILQDTKKFKSFAMKQLRKQIKFIKNSRNRHPTRELSKQMKLIDDRISIAKSLILTYWSSIEKGSISTTYDIAHKLRKILNQCQSDYLHYATLYPNNWTIPSKYASFLINIICDPVEGQYWLRRAEFLRNKSKFLFDSTQTFGFDMFPYIPKVLNHGIDNDNMITNNLELSATIHISKEEENTLQAFDIDTSDSLDTTSSNVLYMGKKAPIHFISRLFYIIFLFFLLAFIALPFIPPILYSNCASQMKSMFNAVTSITGISTNLALCDLILLMKGFQANQLFPDTDEIHQIIKDEKNYHDVDYSLYSTVHSLNNQVDSIQILYGDVISLDTSAGKYIHDITIEQITDKNLPNNTFNSTLFEALNALTGAVLKYSPSKKTSFLDDSWFIFFTENYEKVPYLITNILEYLCSDTFKMINDSVSSVKTSFLIIVAIEVLLVPFFIILVLAIYPHWKYIVNTMKSIPRAAFHKMAVRINRYIEEGDVEAYKKEFRYLDQFSSMIVAKDISGGLPFQQLIVIYILNFGISISSCVCYYFIIQSQKEKLQALPMRYFKMCDINAIYYHYSAIILRRMAIEKGFPFKNDNFSNIFERFYLLFPVLDVLIDEMLCYDWKGLNTGILASPDDMIMSLLESHGNWINQDSDFNRLQTVPHLFTLELIREYIENAIIDSNSSEIIFIDKYEEVWSYIIYIIDHLDQDIMEKLLNMNEQYLDVRIQRTAAIILGVSIVVFLIGVLSVSFLFYYIFQLFINMRFVFSTLAMVDYQYISGMPNIMNLFFGISSGRIENNHSIQITLNEITNLIPEAAIELDSELHVVNVNTVMAESWKLNLENIKSTHISVFMEFLDPKIYDMLYRQASGLLHIASIRNNKPILVNTKVYLKSTNNIIDVHFKSIYFHHTVNTKLVWFFSSVEESNNKESLIDENVNLSNEIKNCIIPERLKGKLSFGDTKRKFTSRYVLLIAINVMNFSKYLENHSPQESLAYFTKFEAFIDELCQNESKDIIKMKRIGASILICLNMNKQLSNYYGSSSEALKFLKSVFSFANDNGYDIRCGMDVSKTTVTALISNNILQFDLFSKSLHKLLMFTRNGLKDNVVVGPKMIDLLPSTITNNASSMQIIDENQKMIWIKRITLI